jgi:protein ImuA
MTLMSGVNLTDSRRLQLAAENSGATGFLLNRADTAPVAAPITRWLISPQVRRSQRFDEPAWKLDLLYCRGGMPRSWTLEWSNRELRALGAPALQKPGLFHTAVVRTTREALAG